MTRTNRLVRRAILALLCTAAAAVVWTPGGGRSGRMPTGTPQLVSIDPLPAEGGALCQWLPATYSISALQELTAGASQTPGREEDSIELNRAPVRIIRDTYPTYSAIAQDQRTGDILLQDENLFGIKIFDRLDNTPPNAAFTEPKRMIGGHLTKLEFNCGLYVDPKTGDIYSVANDTTDTMVIFAQDAKGDVPPIRELTTPRGTYGIAVDESAEELFMAVEHSNTVIVHRKQAQGDEEPIRTIAGALTQLEDPHGLGLDTKGGLIIVSNHGNAEVRTGDVTHGKFEMPSITMYPIKGDGNVAPLRIIEGPRTRLNWPAHVWVDEQRAEFYVANDSDDSVLVFRTTDSGDVAPRRMIRGPKTQIKNPTGVYLDAKNDELWVSNMGNHRATVYPRTANGDVAPRRVIRSAPPEKLAQAIGNPGGVAYDGNREEILVPN